MTVPKIATVVLSDSGADDLLAEQRTMTKLMSADSAPSGVDHYLGASDRLIDAAVERTDLYLKETAG